MDLPTRFDPFKPCYVVLDDNVLGYMIPETLQIGVLRASIRKGFVGQAGPLVRSVPAPIDGRGLRPATRRDFADFHLNVPPDFQLWDAGKSSV